MDWHRDDELDAPSGVLDLLRRVQCAVGGPPLRGTRQLVDSMQMLHASRAVEQSCHGIATSMYVGFQHADRLLEEAGTYQELTASGTRVLAYGQGTPSATVPGVTWRQLPDDRTAVENQWFLVTRQPEPMAFVGFESSTGVRFGTGRARTRDRSWAGFVSDDARLVDALVRHLAEVSTRAHTLTNRRLGGHR